MSRKKTFSRFGAPAAGFGTAGEPLFQGFFFDKCFVFTEDLCTNKVRTDIGRSKQDVMGRLFFEGVS